ncbi:hypothetical protein UFOVP1533_32 [uncultured Caudovirales phage]|uniref:Uncharacterized protein n=1 Tax=uncultured Caudovirales phage TaxID=2100421 RepID=A0A6J5QH54_9CAUD|nr:hypothetical protein UFOVP1086_32 [uncultured Caudovirales phage]CAB4212771.1 hypothetical protein UFOVP1440_32 [uncultured Caudovirales phage]CAB5228290.1 hypothetical protein UFOVP1533_32 [uncultured Caudovirales phage]
MPDTNEINSPADAEVLHTDTPASPQAEPISSVPAEADAKQDSQPTSSGAGDSDANKKPTSLLDAVRRATDKADAASSTVGTDSKSESSETKTNPQAASDEAVKDKSKTEAGEKLPFHNHPRWKEVQSELKEAKPAAEEYRKITTYMQSNGLTPNEVAEGFQIMALMKNNPAEAHKRISEYKSRLDVFVGDKLPDPIREKVENGSIDPDTAKEYATLLAQQQLVQQRNEYAQGEYARQAQEGMRNAVVSWEQQKKSKDPEWSTKEALITDRVRSLMATEQPNTAEQAVALVERAYSQITDQLRKFAPQRQPINPMRSTMSSVTATATPKSLKEAIMRGLAT